MDIRIECVRPKKLISYITSISDDLVIRYEMDNKICKLAFQNFIHLPVFVMDKLFDYFDVDLDGIISKTEFINGMKCLLLGTIEEKLNILCYTLRDKDDKISLDNTNLFFNWLTSDSDCEQTITKIVQSFFENEIDLTYDQFKKKTLLNSDIFFIFISSFIFHLGVHEFFNFKLCEKNDEINLPVPSRSTQLTINKLLGIKLFETRQNHSISESENEGYTDLKVYKIYGDKKMTANKIRFVGNFLILHKYDMKMKDYVFESAKPLYGYFVTELPSVNINNAKFYIFSFINKYGNTLTHPSNIFFCKSKIDLDKIMGILKSKLKIYDMEEKYKIGKEIGHGHYGKVYAATEIKSQEKVAVKVYTKQNLRHKDLTAITSEIGILKFLKQFKHANICNLIEVFEDSKSIYIVTEFLSGGILRDFLIYSEDLLNNSQITLFTHQIADGLKHLQRYGVIHRDIKQENVMLVNESADVKLKIIDFGFATVQYNNCQVKGGYGTLLYSAPEVIQSKPYDIKIDVWSFGVLIYFISTGEFPFKGSDRAIDVINQICHDEFKPKQSVDDYILKIIKSCLVKNSSIRKSMKYLIEEYDS